MRGTFKYLDNPNKYLTTLYLQYKAALSDLREKRTFAQ